MKKLYLIEVCVNVDPLFASSTSDRPITRGDMQYRHGRKTRFVKIGDILRLSIVGEQAFLIYVGNRLAAKLGAEIEIVPNRAARNELSLVHLLQVRFVIHPLPLGSRIEAFWFERMYAAVGIRSVLADEQRPLGKAAVLLIHKFSEIVERIVVPAEIEVPSDDVRYPAQSRRMINLASTVIESHRR